MKIMIEVPDGTQTILVRCFGNEDCLTNDYWITSKEDFQIIGEVDTISRKEAIEAFDPENSRDWYTPDIIETLEELPGRQPEILKCKDCKWCEDADGLMCKNPASWVVATGCDFGCVWGERRER